MPELDGPDAPAEVDLGGGVAFLHTSRIPSRGGLALTHGAGGNCNSVMLQQIAAEWAAAGFTVLRFDLPFRVRKAKGPPHPSRSEDDRLGIAAAVERLRAETTGFIAFGGHSYGGRQGSMIASEQPGLVNGLVLTSYPLHPPGKPDRLRTEHLPALRTPTVVLHGTKDPFATTAELEAAFALVPAPTLLVDIDGAGHDLAPAKYDAARRTLEAAVSLFGTSPSDPSVVVPPFDPSR
ncbi:alpha/beta family hydrolase [Rhodococcus sp. NPDC078407]|uniref:alpha/beta hydrolase family protein n=1 Tax=Rhodococcus sp. NPDC078407 TaxID=3364509 RepID=UPI0037CB89BB